MLIQTNEVGDVVSKVGDVSPKGFHPPSRRRKVAHHKVGDVSPKHHIGESRLAPVFGRQFVLPNGLKSDCPPETGAGRISPT
ncbi:MAG: hypothetical protein LBI18_04245 [Planctomycetaceae bacterium]|nr:hypothetical protein [Planctomycetaceae bacterium]